MCVKSSLFLLVAGLCVGAWANEAEKSETSLVSYVDIYGLNLGLCNNIFPLKVLLYLQLINIPSNFFQQLTPDRLA